MRSFQKHSTSSGPGASDTNLAWFGSNRSSAWATIGGSRMSTCCWAFAVDSDFVIGRAEAGSRRDELSTAASRSPSER